MLTNANTKQETIGESAENETCPNGHAIRSIERLGVSHEVYAQPCGCTITDVQARNFPSGNRVAADGNGELPTSPDEAADVVREILDSDSLPEFVVRADDDTVTIETPEGNGLSKKLVARFEEEANLSVRSVFPLGNGLAVIFELVSPQPAGEQFEQRDLDTECEVSDADEHSGAVQIVVDDEGNVLAMCAECRSDLGYDRVIDEGPGDPRADGGQTFDEDHEELMDVELSDLDAAETALTRYYGASHDEHTHVNRAERGRCLVVITEQAQFKHEDVFRSTPALDITRMRAVNVSDQEDEVDLRLHVEIREAT